MSSKVLITIKARYIWELIFDYDNSRNTGAITHSYEFVKSGSYTSTTFNETVSSEARKLAESGSIQLEAGASYGPVSVSVKAGYETNNEVNTMLGNKTREQTEQTVSWSVKETRQYNIGPHSRLVLYQRHFYGPGMSVGDSALRATSAPLPDDEEEEVLVNLELEPKTFISGIQVVYADQASDAPGDRVRDWFGGSDDINYTFGGKYVWLLPQWTTKVCQALTNFDLVIQGQEDKRYDDLAKGAGGDWRYLIPVIRSSQRLFISELTLVRSPSAINDLPDRIWRDLPQGATGDINKGRKSDYLYLAWQLQRAYAV